MVKPIIDKPRNSSTLYEKIMTTYDASTYGKLGTDNEPKQHAAFIRDVVHSAVTRAVAANYSAYGKGFEERASFRQLKETIDYTMADKSPEDRRAAHFGTLSTRTKAITHTPHPTEMLTDKGIEAEQRLMNFLLSPIGRPLLDERADLNKALEAELSFDEVTAYLGDSSNNDIKTVKDVLNKLIQQLRAGISDKYMTEPLTIEQEMQRSLQMAQRAFDAAPIVAARALRAANTEKGKDVENPRRLSPEELQSLRNVIDMQTWSPGDQDNKGQMRSSLIEEGNRMSREEINVLYGVELVKLITELNVKKKLAERTNEATEDISEAQQNLQEMLGKITLEMEEKKDFRKLINQVKAQGLGTEIINGLRDSNPAKQAYQNAAELEQDLFTLRDKHEKLFDLRKTPTGEETNLSTLDGVILQVMNFGDHLLRTQIRQNQEDIGNYDPELHKLREARAGGKELAKFTEEEQAKLEQRVGAMQVIVEKLLEEGLVTQEHAADTEMLLDTVYSDTKIGDYIKNWVKEIGDIVVDNSKEGENVLGYKYAASPYYTPEDEYSELFTVYHVTKTLEVAGKSPEAIPNYIIAESEKPQDVFNSLFIAKAMLEEKPGVDVGNNHPEFEIYPLFEHYDHITNADKTMKVVFNNKHFNAQQEALQRAVKIYDPAKGEVRDKTIADRLREMGYSEEEIQARAQEKNPEKPDDYLNTTLHYKRTMFAGSDSFKGGGVFMEPIMDEVKYNLESNYLDQGYEAYYEEGAGNAVYRKQPVNAPDETVQGNAMRWHPVEAAVRVTRYLAESAINTVLSFVKPEQKQNKNSAIGKFVQAYQDREAEKMPYQINRSSLTHLRNHRDKEGNKANHWNELQDRCHQGVHAYQELYNSDAYQDMLSEASAAFFAKESGFAARKAARNRAAKSKEETYPPSIDVHNVRAISYGLSLMNSMHHLYYGMEAFATNGDEKISAENAQEIAQRYQFMYKNSKNFQNVVNRATYGVMMADMDSAWKFLDNEIVRTKPDAKNPQPTISVTDRQTGEDHIFNVHELADMDPKDERLAVFGDEKNRNAAVSLAKIDYQHHKASLFLTELHRLETKVIGTELKDVVKKSVAQEIEDIRANIDPERHTLAKIHQELKDGLRVKPIKTTLNQDQQIFNSDPNKDANMISPKETYRDILYNVATIKNALERPLTTMLYPEYGAAIDKQRGMDIAA